MGSTTKGFWWKPESPEQRFFGTLERDEDSDFLLTVYSDTDCTVLAEKSAPSTLHGTDEKGKPVTLLSASRAGHYTVIGGMTTVRIRPGHVLRGVHVPNKTAFRATTLTLRIQQLYGWLGMSGFGRNVMPDMTGNVDLAYRQPEASTHQPAEGFTVTFSVQSMFSTPIQSISVTEEAYVCLKRDSGFTFDECWEMTGLFRRLLHFAILKPVHAVSMSLDGLTGAEQDNVNDDSVTVESGRFHEPMSELPYEGFWVFRFDDVKAQFGRFFADWIAYCGKHDEALGCYTTTTYHRLPATVEHLCLTQALDAYHGTKFNSHGQRGFQKKVEELCRPHEKTLAGLVDDIPIFAEQVKDTRDYCTHHNPEDLQNRHVVRAVPDLIRLNEKLTILFQSCVLTDIGIPADRLPRLQQQLATHVFEL